MNWEQDWFKIFITIATLFGGVWMMYFRKNDEVLKLILKNQQTQIDKLEEEHKKNNTEEKKEREKNEENIAKLTIVVNKLSGKFDRMGDRWQAEEKQLKRSNDLKDKELLAKDKELEIKAELAEHQKIEFSKNLQLIVQTTNEIAETHIVHGKSQKTG